MSWTNIYLPITTSLLLASTMSSTDSASVFAILRSQKMNLKHNLRPMLELESGSNDPMAYMLTIVLIQFIQSAGMGVGAIAASFIIQFIVGAAAGYVLGKLAIRMLNKLNIDNQALYPILLLAFVFFTFSITDLLKGNGYLAVYIAGIMVGNNKIMHRKDIYTFMDGLTWLFQIIMFLCLGLLVNPHEMLEVAAVALLIGVFMIVIGRPLSVFLCLLPFRKITMKSRLFVSWVGLEVLSKEFRVITMDPRGQGNSSKTCQGNTIRRNAQDIKELIDHLGLEHVVLLGWSLASSIVVSYAAEFEQYKLNGLVTMDGSLYPFSDADWNHHRGRDYNLQNWFDTYLPLYYDPKLFYDKFIARVSCAEGMDDEIRAWFEAECKKTMPWTALELHYDFCLTDNFSNLKKITVPYAV
mgnify:CR=1 FL=1